MPALVLIKHAAPVVEPHKPASSWSLGDEGMTAARSLGQALSSLKIGALYCSREPKASQTAASAGAVLGLTPQPRDGLQEHRRETEPFLSQPAFQASVRRLFDRRDERVFGEETAREALARFAAAVDAALTEASGANVGIVAHGTVISLLAAERCGADGYDLWQGLGMPSYIVIDLPSWRMLEVIERMPDG